MKKIFYPLLLLALNVTAQSPATIWAACLGGTQFDRAEHVKATTDGGAIVIGTTSSSDGDITDAPGYIDFWIVKLSATGAIQWQKTLGSNNTDYAYGIDQTSDGGYVFTGAVGSTNRDVTPSAFGSEIWVVRLNATGDIQWQKTFGGSGEDYGYCIKQTTDGGFVVAGSSNSNDGNVTGNHGVFDVWILKLSATGALQWQKSYGGSNFEEAYAIRQTADGGYLVAAQTESTDGDVTGMNGFYDIWILKLNALGNLVWQKSIGGAGQERPNDLVVVNGNSCLIAGTSNSNNGDTDAWVVKLDATGTIQWQHTYGGTGSDTATGIVQTTGGFALSGYTESFNSGDITGAHPNGDGWLFKIDDAGLLQWQKYAGSNSIDIFRSIDKTPSGDLIAAGSSMGTTIEGAASHGFEDYLVLKLSATLAADNFVQQQSLVASPNPVTGTLHFDNKKVGWVEVFDMGGRLLLSGAVTDNRIELDRLAPGHYIVKAQSADGVAVIQVLKQ